MHSLENKHAKNHFCCFHQLHWDFRIFLNHFFMLATSSHFVKSIRVRSYSGPHFPAFGLKTERYGVSFHIQSKYGKIRTSITPNTDTFYTVWLTCNVSLIALDSLLTITGSSHQRCSIEKSVLMPESCNFIKKEIWHGCFPVNFVKFLRTPFLQNTFGRLLLNDIKTNNRWINKECKFLTICFGRVHIFKW